MNVDNKSSDSFGNFCTILGGALLGMAMVDQAAKTMAPEIQKLASVENIENSNLLPMTHEKRETSEDHKQHNDEIAELKRKLAEYESKTEKQVD